MNRFGNLDDVQRLLPDLLIPDEESSYIEALLLEAADLIEAYCRRGFSDPVPDAVKRVAARMVARAYQQDVELDGPPLAATSEQLSAGPFSRSYSFDSNQTRGGVWLAASDKARLRGYRGGIFMVRAWS